MGVTGAVVMARRGSGSGGKIDHVGGAGGDDLRHPGKPSRSQARLARGHDRALQIVVHLLRAKVGDADEFALPCQIGKGAAGKRLAGGRKASPGAGVIDSQSVKTPETRNHGKRGNLRL